MKGLPFVLRGNTLSKQTAIDFMLGGWGGESLSHSSRLNMIYLYRSHLKQHSTTPKKKKESKTRNASRLDIII